jgi:DNA-binding Lrp family transcriptional regulator
LHWKEEKKRGGIVLSKIDTNILRMLQKNARIPVSEIARETHLSENGVRYRLEKLEAAGCIKGYSCIVDPEKIGKELAVIFLIKMQPNKIMESMGRLMRIECLTNIYQTTGSHSIVAKGYFENAKELSKFMENDLFLNYQIQDCEVKTVLRPIKESTMLI